MQPALSFEQAPPISVPYRFFLTAPVFGAVAGLVLAWFGPVALQSRWSPGALAMTHLIVVDFMLQAMEDMRRGNQRGRVLAQGAARAGAHYGAARVPTVKGQSISAYDPRVVEVTGISMMVSAQGADHTAGNLPVFDCKDKTTAELVDASLGIQTACAAADSLGLCLFGRAVTNVSAELIVTALNDAHGTNFDASFMKTIGMEALKMEWEFNKAAGFTEKDDELPEFFYKEALAPSNKTARHHSTEVNRRLRELLA